MAASSQNQAHHPHVGHEVSLKVFVNVFIALLIMTVVTVAVAQVDLGNLNLVVAMLIASVKAGLVAAFFMHLKYESPLLWMYVAIPIVLLFVLVGGIFLDDPLRVPARKEMSTATSIQSADPGTSKGAPVADSHHH